MTQELPPHNLDAEHGVVGSMLISPADCIPLVTRVLKPADFRDYATRTCYELALQTWQEKAAVDVLLLTHELREAGKLAEVGGPAFVTHLFTFTPTAANVEYYVQIVREHANVFRLWRVCRAVAERATRLDAAEELAGMAGDLSQLLVDLTASTFTTPKTMHEHVEDALMRYDEAASRNGKLPEDVLPTGITGLDAELEGGLVLGDYVVLSAVTSGGKSALAGQIAAHLAVVHGCQALIASYEMSAKQLVDRMIALQTGIPSVRLRMGKLSLSDLSQLGDLSDLSAAGIHLRDRIGRWSVDDVCAEARAVKAQHGLHLLVVDYLQLVPPRPAQRGRDQQRERQVAETSRALIQLAKELNIIVIALSQLNDDGMLRESRAIGHDADVVLTIEDSDPPHDEKRVIRINKNRSGARDRTVPVAWDGPLMKFGPARP